jgi:hypothetical protein
MFGHMNRFRSLFWLLALIAFLAPSLGTVSMAHVMQPVEQAGLYDCPDHAPPPDCPAQGTAKHAAGLCCLAMGAGVALMPAGALAQTSAPFHAPLATVTLNLNGLIFTQDPPPPRG